MLHKSALVLYHDPAIRRVQSYVEQKIPWHNRICRWIEGKPCGQPFHGRLSLCSECAGSRCRQYLGKRILDTPKTEQKK